VLRTRRESRERALSLCYERDIRDTSAASVLDALPVPADPYATDLVLGVDEHRAEIDALIGSFAQRWSVERMPVVDRNLLRIGCYELCHRPEIPVAVVITEAVELAKQYSTDGSGRFVNGLLARIADRVRPEGRGDHPLGDGLDVELPARVELPEGAIPDDADADDLGSDADIDADIFAEDDVQEPGG
jgi:transcription antitermination protein NusB